MKKITRSTINEEAGIPAEIQEQVKKNLKGRKVDYSDIPAMTQGEVKNAFRQIKDQKKKVLFSLRLKKDTIDWWKESVGDGYTTAMAELLERATKDPEVLKKYLH